MNLFEALNEDSKIKLLNSESEFPHTIESLIRVLKSKEFIHDLTIGEANTLCVHLEIPFSIASIYNIFHL